MDIEQEGGRAWQGTGLCALASARPDDAAPHPLPHPTMLIRHWGASHIGSGTRSWSKRVAANRALRLALRLDWPQLALPAARHPISISFLDPLSLGFLLPCWPSLAPCCQKLLLAAPITKDAIKGRPIFDYSDATWMASKWRTSVDRWRCK